MISRVISNKPRILSPHSSSKPPRFRDLRTLQLSLHSFFASRRLFSATCGLFLQNTRGGGYPNTSAPSFAPAVICATWRLYPLWPHSIAHTSRHHGGVPFLATRLPRASRGYFPKSFRMRRSKIASPEVLWNEQIQEIRGEGVECGQRAGQCHGWRGSKNGLESF